jgi:putative heme-binding domain-containing protein
MAEALTNLASAETRAPALAATLRALGDLRVARAMPALKARLGHRAPEVRMAAAGALAEIGGDLAVEVLIPARDDPDVLVRRQITQALGSLRAKSAVPALLHAYADPETRLEAVAGLARVPDLRALDAYLDGLAAKTPAVRADCRKALAAIREPARPFLREKLESGTLPASVVSELKSLYGDDRSIAFLFQTAPKPVTAADYSSFALAGRGDPKRGRSIYMDPRGVGCAKCHRVNGIGGEGGPDLSKVASTYGRAELVDAILSPSKKIADGYRLTTIALVGGVVLSGTVIDNQDELITLVDSQGEKHTVRKTEIEQKTERDGSSMPEGLHTGLSLQEFADLVAYLESLK